MAGGACNCGGVAFQVSAEITKVFVCHCSICRRATGANGIAVVVVDDATFQWTRGEGQIAEWKKPTGDWEIRFCRVCGSTLPVANDASTTAIPAGLLSEGGEDLRVAAHIFVGSKAVWDEIGDAGRQYHEAFGKS